MSVEVLNALIILAAVLVLFIAMMSRAQTRAGRYLAFLTALAAITVATVYVFGTQQDVLGVVVLGICPLVASAVAMRALHSLGASPFVWGVGAFFAGVAGSFPGVYLGLMVACRGGDC